MSTVSANYLGKISTYAHTYFHTYIYLNYLYATYICTYTCICAVCFLFYFVFIRNSHEALCVVVSMAEQSRGIKKNRSPNCSVLQEQQQVSVGKKLPTPVKACITTPHTPSHTDTHTHTKRRLKCCSEMETGRHNTGTGYGSQNKNREN